MSSSALTCCFVETRYSRSTDLQFAMFLEGREDPRMVALPFGEGSLLDAMDRVDQLDNMFMNETHRIRYVGSRDEYRATFTAMLQLLLYLCSEEPDMPAIQHPSTRRTLDSIVVDLFLTATGWSSAAG